MTESELKKFYEEGTYFEIRKKVFLDLNSPFQRYRIRKVLDIYTPLKDEIVLDLGCGWGTFCFAIAPYCKEITGLDFSQKAIEICKGALQKTDYRNVSFICADAQNTGLGPESYDVVICADLLEHLYPPDCAKVLDESTRILKKKGKLVIWTPHGGHFLEILKAHNIILKKDPSHVDYKSMAGLVEGLHKRNFKILKAYYTESHILFLKIIERLLLKFASIMRRRIAILAEKI